MVGPYTINKKTKVIISIFAGRAGLIHDLSIKIQQNQEKLFVSVLVPETSSKVLENSI